MKKTNLCEHNIEHLKESPYACDTDCEYDCEEFVLCDICDDEIIEEKGFYHCYECETDYCPECFKFNDEENKFEEENLNEPQSMDDFVKLNREEDG